MKYFFPGPLASSALPAGSLAGYLFTVNSGENALRLILRSYNIGKGARIAVPLYVCDSVKNAVLKEGMQPVYFDLHTGNSYWTNYDKALLEKEKPSVLILVHLYGFLHPDTKDLMEYCKAKGIFLVHDLAQCYGLNVADITYGSIFYSFSAGKSTTAAGGAIITDMDEEFYTRNVKKPRTLAAIKAALFMKSRIYSYTLSPIERMGLRLLRRYDFTAEITTMTSLQKKAADYVMSVIGKIKQERQLRYNLLSSAVKDNPSFTIPYSSSVGMYFKFIVYVKNDPAKFNAYLNNAQVPHFSLFNTESVARQSAKEAVNFQQNAVHFVEFSTEASLPIDEVKRVAEVLKAYK